MHYSPKGLIRCEGWGVMTICLYKSKYNYRFNIIEGEMCDERQPSPCQFIDETDFS